MAKEIFELVGRILIDNADANTDIDSTTQKAKGLADALEGTGTSADNTGKKIGSSGKFGAGSVWFGNMMTKMTDMAINMGKFIGKTGFGFNANMEAYQNQFESLLGDADKASQLVADLQLLAKISPLGMEGLANNAVSLLNAGTELTDIIPTLEMLGNLSLGDTNKMNSVVRAYTQILSKGQLMAQEMYQLGDAGVPVRQIMTLYGGEEYADGTWYEKKLRDPTYMIPAENMTKAFLGATAEGGKWHDYMFKMMDTWSGQVDRMGEEGKESLGALMNPFFEVAKSDVLPKVAESLGMFGTWASENQDTLTKMAEAVGDFASISFDAVLDCFKWMTENGSAVAVAIGTIATAMAVAAVSAHPYAAAVLAVATALAYMHANNADGDSYEQFFDAYSDEDLAKLQAYVKAAREAQEAEQAYYDTMLYGGNEVMAENAFLDAQAKRDAAYEEANAIEGLIGTYNSWRSGQAEGGSEIWLDVPLRVAEGAEGEVQTELDGMSLEMAAKILPDMSAVYASQNTALTYYASVMPNVAAFPLNGSHANGLDYVPHDGYIARLHRGESVLTQQEASVWRSGMGGGFDVNALASSFASSVAAALSGKPVVLESGAVIGQLLPAIDAGLGTTSARKGRRN